MIAEILCVGTELLMGQVLNTNAQFLSRRLSALGITQQHQTVVGDNAQRLEDAYRLALSRADIVITSGASARRSMISPSAWRQRLRARSLSSSRRRRRWFAPASSSITAT